MDNNQKYYSCCPVCKNNVIKDKIVINGFTIVKCQSCRLMFVREKLSQKELDYYYEKTMRLADNDFVYLNNENLENLKYYYRNLRALIEKWVPKGRILDIGCNTGSFLDVMDNCECFGVERSLTHAKIAKEKYGNNIFTGVFEDYQAPKFLFDCITLQDVLDHMADPVEALKKCNTLLQPKGLLVVKVHDLSSIYAKLMGRRFYAFIPPLHLCYFTRTALNQALKEAGFSLVFYKHMSHLMFISTIFYRLSQGNQKSIFFYLYKLINKTWLKRVKIYKNLHDIITVFAVKKA